MRNAFFGLFVALLAASARAQVFVPVEAGPLEGLSSAITPEASPALDGLQTLDEQLGTLGALEPLSTVEPLQRTFDGLHGLQSAPTQGTIRRGSPAIPPARNIPFKNSTFPSFAFSQHTKIGDQLVRAIDHTQDSLLIAIHGLSIPGVAEAIVRAKGRLKDLRVICNEEHMFPANGHQRSPELQMLVDAGVDIRVLRGTGKFGVMHNKFALFDGELMEYGSFNWSEQANDGHYENAKFDDAKGRISGFNGYFDWMWAIARPVEGYQLGAPKLPGPPPADSGPGVQYKGERFPDWAYSPNGGIEARLVKAIELTLPGETIDVAMFAFFSQPIAEALVEAHNRGVVVRVVSDKSQGKRSPQVRYLIENGVPLRFSSGHAGPHSVMHNKFGIFNGEMLETGSFNWSDNAESHNFENANFVVDAQDIAGYQADFEEIWAQASAAAIEELDPAAFLPNPPLVEDAP